MAKTREKPPAQKKEELMWEVQQLLAFHPSPVPYLLSMFTALDLTLIKQELLVEKSNAE